MPLGTRYTVAMDMTRVAADEYTVFEIVNARLKEIFVGVASDAELRAVPLRLPSNATLLHWGLSESEPAHPIQLDLTKRAADIFVENYVKSALPNGWRFLT